MDGEGEEGLREGEEECMICRSDVLPASVSLLPCKHAVCISCVETMRAKNIFRADQGVRCPFCRGYVDQYEALDSADDGIRAVLVIANGAAAVATNARGGMRAGGRTSIANLDSGYDRSSWECPKCKEHNEWYSPACVFKGCLGDDPRRKRKVPKLTERMKFESETAYRVKEKYHPQLNAAFAGVGVPFGDGKTATDAVPKEIAKAMGRSSNMEPFLRMLSSVTENASLMLELTKDLYANYTIQDFIEVAGKMRTAVAQYPAVGASLNAFKAENRGMDPLAALLYTLFPAIGHELACDKMGTHVIQKLTEHASPGELIDLGNRMFDNGPATTVNFEGSFAMLRITDKILIRCFGPSRDTSERAQLVADRLCSAFLADNESLTHILNMGAKETTVVASAIAMASPLPGAAALVGKLALSVPRLLKGKQGSFTVKDLLRMRAPGWDGDAAQQLRRDDIFLAGGAEREVSSAGLIRDFVCMVAFQLRGQLVGWVVTWAASGSGSSATGPPMVEMLLERLAEEQEVAWLRTCTQELIGSAQLDEVLSSPAGRSILTKALCFDVVDGDDVDGYLMTISTRSKLGQHTVALADEVYARRTNVVPPAARYTEPSSAQPDARYAIEDGRMVFRHPAGGIRPVYTPPPPPPPPARPPPQQQPLTQLAQPAAATTASPREAESAGTAQLNNLLAAMQMRGAAAGGGGGAAAAAPAGTGHTYSYTPPAPAAPSRAALAPPTPFFPQQPQPGGAAAGAPQPAARAPAAPLGNLPPHLAAAMAAARSRQAGQSPAAGGEGTGSAPPPVAMMVMRGVGVPAAAGGVPAAGVAVPVAVAAAAVAARASVTASAAPFFPASAARPASGVTGPGGVAQMKQQQPQQQQQQAAARMYPQQQQQQPHQQQQHQHQQQQQPHQQQMHPQQAMQKQLQQQAMHMQNQQYQTAGYYAAAHAQQYTNQQYGQQQYSQPQQYSQQQQQYGQQQQQYTGSGTQQQQYSSNSGSVRPPGYSTSAPQYHGTTTQQFAAHHGYGSTPQQGSGGAGGYGHGGSANANGGAGGGAAMGMGGGGGGAAYGSSSGYGSGGYGSGGGGGYGSGTSSGSGAHQHQQQQQIGAGGGGGTSVHVLAGGAQAQAQGAGLHGGGGGGQRGAQSWACGTCSYQHSARHEWTFMSCAMCGTVRGNQ
ncbi:hypothetical protein FOA52_008126 [Chlamydomonas sp. UWO 241]|nr:hypothetical protein FOA52_008126 [Chlamydomonas sp. UWO 241]